ncbi:IS3 family transposase [Carnobacterium divergens]|uniref:IS3 family transposase n=1 Tax=Carnobacterium divergens TaxID=2748 RepID=UPI0035DD3FFD
MHLIRKIYIENKFRYAYRKVTVIVNQIMKVNRNTVQRWMQKSNLQYCIKIKKDKE